MSTFRLRRSLLAGLTVLAAAGCPLAPQSSARERSWPVVEQAPVKKSIPLAAATRLVVDNVWGAIEVTAWDGATIELEATRTTRARTSADHDAASREVVLDIGQTGGDVVIRVDGPFRCNCDCSDRADGGRRSEQCRDGRRWPGGYEVQYDFTLKVPRAVAIDVRTVNQGDIHVTGMRAGFDVRNVNGAIALRDVAGAGRAHTVNGGVTASFAAVPQGTSSFETVNGDIEVTFPPGLAADLQFKTFNGDVFSDFVTTPLPAVPVSGERRGAKFVYKSDRRFGVRVGPGGPEISFDTLNGDIRILQTRT